MNGAAQRLRLHSYCGTSLITGPLGAGETGCAGCSVFCTGFWVFPNCPIGPYAIAIASTAIATIAPRMPANFSEFISYPDTPAC
jgi:hypothetical protein